MNKQELKRVLGKAGPHLGDLVWSELVVSGETPIERAALRVELAAIDPELAKIVDEPSAERALGRAMAKAACPENYFFDRAKKRASDILLMRRTPAGKRTTDVAECLYRTRNVDASHGFAAAVEYEVSGATFTDDGLEAHHALSRAFDDYARYLDHVDLGAIVVSAITGPELNGVRLRSSGGIYWIPVTSSGKVRALAEAVAKVGKSELTIVPVHETPDAQRGLARDLHRSLESEINDVLKELHGFAAKLDSTRVSTLETRLDDLDDIEARAQLVSNVLGNKLSEIEKAIGEAKKKTATLIEKVDPDYEWADEEADDEAAQ